MKVPAVLRGMPLRFGSPSSYPIVNADKVLFDKNSIVAVGEAPDQLPIHRWSLILAAKMGSQGIGKGGRRCRNERWRKWTGGSFRTNRISGLEAEWGFRDCGHCISRSGSGYTVGWHSSSVLPQAASYYPVHWSSWKGSRTHS
jgi:hypothetical protein